MKRSICTILAGAVGLMALFSMKAANAQSAEKTLDYINKKLAECVGAEEDMYAASNGTIYENRMILYPTGFIEFQVKFLGICHQQGIHLKHTDTASDYGFLDCKDGESCAYILESRGNCETPLLDSTNKGKGYGYGYITIPTCKEKPHVKPRIVKAINHLLQVWEPEELEELF